MTPWIRAHGTDLDELVVLGSGMGVALGARLLVAHRRAPDDPEEPTGSNQAIWVARGLLW